MFAKEQAFIYAKVSRSVHLSCLHVLVLHMQILQKLDSMV